MKKMLLAGFMAALLLLTTACGNGAVENVTSADVGAEETTALLSEETAEETTAAEDTSAIPEEETSATADEESSTVEETTPELTPATPELADEFALSPVYSIAPTVREESMPVNVGGVTLNIDMTSTFYGTESAIDRDTFHWGDMIRYANLRVPGYQTDFRVADLNGDRTGELLSYNDGVLEARELSSRGGAAVVYTQTLGFNGSLCGAGPLNGDGYTDLVLWSEDAGLFVLGWGSAEGFTYEYAATEGLLPADGETVLAGDINADGVMELVFVADLAVRSYTFDEGNFTLLREDTLLFAEPGQFLMYGLGDINSDGYADLICMQRDPAGGLAKDGAELYGTRIYMSRGNGHFGSYEAEGDNKNINVEHTHDKGFYPLFVAGGDVSGDGVDDVVLVAHNPSNGNVILLSGVYPSEAPAYDYSSHIIKTDDGYIMYTGGLYCDYNTDKYPSTPADHITAYTSKDGMTWQRNLDAACFYLGGELGMSGYQVGDAFTEKWWYGNTMEPEVVFVDGVYYMYYQVENYTYSREGNLMGADRIGVATSTDGIHFERKTDSPALISSDMYSCFTHQEVIYVPDDPDGKCFWMYVRYVHNNVHVKHIRIRSADPLCFNMDEDCTDVSGFYQIGNQIGYINDYDGEGNRLFVRITFIEHSEDGDHSRRHTVPTLQFSLDGLRWYSCNLRMAGADPDHPDEWNRRNVYFLGFSTINGTGEIPKTADGTGYEFIWVGCTCNSPVAPEIFTSSEGVGKAVFTITVE